MKKTKKAAKKTPNLIDGLCQLLADNYSLYLKTQNFHWNVGGPHFYSLHKMFEEQYEALAEANDVIAERIRALNAPAPGSFSAFQKLTSLEEADAEATDAEMVTILLCDHDTLRTNLDRLIAI